MTLGPVMIDIEDTELSDEDIRLLSNPVVGGLILFSRNYSSLEQLESLVNKIHEIRTPPLLIAVDQEGGRVQRFKDGFSMLPELRSLGNLYDLDPESGLHLAHECGWLMASEIRSVGIDISFAPVLDIDSGVSSVIGSRAFHSNPSISAALAKHYVKGMNEAGMQATGKHFPGHGSVIADSHHLLPVDTRDFNEIKHLDLYPFEYMINQGIHALMIAHIVFPQVDDNPAGFSSVWLQEILRKKMNFQGAVFSDDLNMKGADVAGNYVERSQKALHAGCDMILICNNRPAAIDIIHSLKGYNDPASSMRLAIMQNSSGMIRDELITLPRWQKARKLLKPYIQEPSLNLDLSIGVENGG